MKVCLLTKLEIEDKFITPSQPKPKVKYGKIDTNNLLNRVEPIWVRPKQIYGVVLPCYHCFVVLRGALTINCTIVNICLGKIRFTRYDTNNLNSI